MLRISFDFNEHTNTVSNVTVSTGRQRIDTSSVPNVESSDMPDVVVLDNKLQLSKNGMQKLNVRPDDRISIQYISTGIGKAQPVIGKAEVFTDRLDGNRVTKKGTVSFRGEKRNTLLEFGTEFNLEEYKNDIWKLIMVDDTTTDSDLSEEQEYIDELDKTDVDKEIEELTSSIDEDLPF